MCLYNLKFGKLVVLASILLWRPVHVASLTWFSRLCINTSLRSTWVLRATFPLLDSSVFQEVLNMETKCATSTSTSGSSRSSPVFGATQRKRFHGIVLHILEDHTYVTLTFSQALSPASKVLPTLFWKIESNKTLYTLSLLALLVVNLLWCVLCLYIYTLLWTELCLPKIHMLKSSCPM